MIQLNKTELQLMKYLWKLEKAFLKDIVELYEEPKPAYTTISTLINRMCIKNYIGFEKLGRDKQYFPLLEKKKYFKSQIGSTIHDFFNNSPTQFASFFTVSTEMTIEQLEELESLVQEQLKIKKQSND